MASLRSLVETALATALDGVCDNIYIGIDSEDKVLPCVICRAASCEDVEPTGGRYLVTCEIIVKDNAADDSTFDDITQSVKAIIDSSTIASAMTGEELFVYGVASASSVEWGYSGEAWVETRKIQIECAPQPS